MPETTSQAKNHPPVSLAQTKKLLQQWQEKLWLQDWHIDIELCDSDALPNPDTDSGCVGINFQYRRARIWLLRPSQRTADNSPLENTLVHELLHIALAPFTHDMEIGSVAQMREEQLINALTAALTGLSYRNA